MNAVTLEILLRVKEQNMEAFREASAGIAREEQPLLDAMALLEGEIAALEVYRSSLTEEAV